MIAFTRVCHGIIRRYDVPIVRSCRLHVNSGIYVTFLMSSCAWQKDSHYNKSYPKDCWYRGWYKEFGLVVFVVLLTYIQLKKHDFKTKQRYTVTITANRTLLVCSTRTDTSKKVVNCVFGNMYTEVQWE